MQVIISISIISQATALGQSLCELLGMQRRAGQTGPVSALYSAQFPITWQKVTYLYSLIFPHRTTRWGLALYESERTRLRV